MVCEGSVVCGFVVAVLASVNTAGLVGGGACGRCVGRIAHELDEAFGVDIADEAYARAEPLELAC